VGTLAKSDGRVRVTRLDQLPRGGTM